MSNQERIARLEKAVEALTYFQEQRVRDADEALLRLFTKPKRQSAR